MTPRLVVAPLLLAVTGLLMFGAYQSSVPSNDAERACLSALRHELGLPSDTEVETVWSPGDGEHVRAEWHYGSMSVSSWLPLARGEVACRTGTDGELRAVVVDRY
jgi:hypothetical protein